MGSPAEGLLPPEPTHAQWWRARALAFRVERDEARRFHTDEHRSRQEAEEANAALRTLLHSTQDELAAALARIATLEVDVIAAEQRAKCSWDNDWLTQERDAARAENQRLADALAATVQRRGELETALDYCQQQRRTLQESATQQVEGLQREVATLRARCEELAAQACCSMREAYALLCQLRGAA